MCEAEGQRCGERRLQPLYTALCQMRDAQSVLIGVLVEEGCLCRLLLTSLVSQQLLSRPGLLSLLATQLFAQCLRCLQLQDLEQQRSSAPSSPRSSSAASTQHSLEHLPPDPPPTLWWPMFGGSPLPLLISFLLTCTFACLACTGSAVQLRRNIWMPISL